MARARLTVGLLAGLTVAAMLSVLFVLGARTAWYVVPDFEFFYRAGQYVLAHAAVAPAGNVGYLPWYLPFLSRLFVAFALLPGCIGGLLWAGLNLLMLLGILCWSGRHFNEAPDHHWPASQFIPFLLTFPYWIYQFRLNQLTTLVLVLCLASLLLWESGRPWLAGVSAGLAVLIKTVPAVLVGWFVLKRQWRTAGGAVLTCAVLGPAADLAAFGPDSTISYYRRWYHQAIQRGSARYFILNGVEVDHRNQAAGVTLGRLLHPINCQMRFWNDPRMSAVRGRAFTINLADLSAPSVADLYRKWAIAVGVVLAWVLRCPAARLNRAVLRTEWSLILLAMLWFMPVLRLYHYAWGYPTLAMLCSH
ncbi:MAG: glycosyltransferase family 87 protein, partial [Phycisphaerae bacterium]